MKTLTTINTNRDIIQANTERMQALQKKVDRLFKTRPLYIPVRILAWASAKIPTLNGVWYKLNTKFVESFEKAGGISIMGEICSMDAVNKHLEQQNELLTGELTLKDVAPNYFK